MRSRFGFPVTPFVRNVLAPRARALRMNRTRSEELLWSAIRSSQLGVRFRQQAVLGRFIVDFFASSAKLVIEIDGIVHQAREHLDCERDRFLSANGLRILRLTDAFVESDLRAAVEKIRSAL